MPNYIEPALPCMMNVELSAALLQMQMQNAMTYRGGMVVVVGIGKQMV